MKVLVVDPDWRFSHQAASFLESHAHLVVTTADPREALERARHWRPDVTILAAELAEKGLLADLAALRPRPAILLTEHMERFDRAWRVWQAGGDELLLKPVFRGEELHLAIVAALENATVGSRPCRALAVPA